jgi:hypothetical protein
MPDTFSARTVVLAGLTAFAGTALLSFLFGDVGAFAGSLACGMAMGFVLFWSELSR